jgi:hypothetical protein
MSKMAAMASELDITTLAAAAAGLAASDTHRWRVTHIANTLRVYVTLTPVGSADVYCLRLDFGEALASGPPSVTFCDPDTYVEGRLCDWPRGLTDYFKPPPSEGLGWLCNPWTREGRAHHAEWRSYGWRPTRVVWRVATAIQDILDKPGSYTGRAA